MFVSSFEGKFTSVGEILKKKQLVEVNFCYANKKLFVGDFIYFSLFLLRISPLVAPSTNQLG